MFNLFKMSFKTMFVILLITRTTLSCNSASPSTTNSEENSKSHEVSINGQCQISKNAKRVKPHSKLILSRKKRVIGGQNVLDSEHPWAVKIFTPDDAGWNAVCGGTLLDNAWVLTAAQCFQNKNTSKTVFTVSGRINQTTSTTFYNAQKIVIHPSFKSSKFIYEFDAALVKLKLKGTESDIDQLEPACFSPTLDIDNIEAKAFGWGYDDEDSQQLADNLKEVEQHIYPNDECFYSKADHLQFDKEQMVCAGPKDKSNADQSLCTGDFGGGLIVTADDDSHAVAVVGIVSWRLMCAGPTVFQRVAPIYSWINETINQL